MVNVKKVVTNKKFTQPITRNIRTETINQFGESTLVSAPSVIQAIVTSPSQQDLDRLPEGTVYIDAIIVTTATQLNTAVVDRQPDTILYHNEHYIVKVTNDYNIYGYTRAICALTDLQPQPVN